MKLLYGLALALIFFEGFISQCEGAIGSEEAITVKLGNLPIEVLEIILFKAGFNATKEAVRCGIDCVEAVKKIFEDRILHIDVTRQSNQSMFEFIQDGDIYLRIKGLDRTLALFNNVGDYVKKIKVILYGVDDDNRRQINKKIISQYLQQFTELHIDTNNSFSSFLRELSKIVKDIQFPNLRKFVYKGPKFGTSYDLNSIFPNLQSLTLIYKYGIMKINTSCMANVTKLNELKLEVNPESYQRRIHELENIYKNNDQLSSLTVLLHNDINILYWIADHMTKLQTLEIRINVETFLGDVPENPPFHFPKVERLNIRDYCEDHRIIKFISRFEMLKILDVDISNSILLPNIKKLVGIHELITYERPRLDVLKGALKEFGRKKDLKKIIWVAVSKSYCYTYFKPNMIKINEELKESKEPTWRINCIEYKRFDSMEMLRK